MQNQRTYKRLGFRENSPEITSSKIFVEIMTEKNGSRKSALEKVETAGLDKTAHILFRGVREEDWDHVVPVLLVLNESFRDPLPPEEAERIIQFAMVHERGKQIGNPTTKKLTPITLPELLALPAMKVEWVIENLLPVGGIGVLSGDPASFKTWTLLHIASCVAEGIPVFGNFPVKKGKVLIIDEENHLSLLKERAENLGVSARDVLFLSQSGFKIDKEENMRSLADIVLKNDIKLVLIDSLVRVNSKDENVAREIADLFEPIKSLTRGDVSVLLTHHHRKQSATGKNSPSQSLRGSSDILASIDTHIAVTRNLRDKRLVFEQSKSRYAQEIEPFEVNIVSGPNKSVSLEYEGVAEREPLSKDQAKEGILSILSLGPTTRAEIETELTLVGKSAIAVALRELVADGTAEVEMGAHGKKTYMLKNPDSQLDVPI